MTGVLIRRMITWGNRGKKPARQHLDLGLPPPVSVLLHFGEPGPLTQGQECNVGSPPQDGRLVRSPLELGEGSLHPAVALVRQRASELGIWLVVVTGIAFVVGDAIRHVCTGPCVWDMEITQCPEVSGRKHGN